VSERNWIRASEWVAEPRRIIGVFDGPAAWSVGADGLERIEPIAHSGDQAMVPWLRLWYSNGSTVELNLARITGVEFACEVPE